MPIDSGTASIPLHPAIRRAIEAGEGWTEMKGLWCTVCGEPAYREAADPNRTACYTCNTVTFNPDASFSDKKPVAA